MNRTHRWYTRNWGEFGADVKFGNKKNIQINGKSKYDNTKKPLYTTETVFEYWRVKIYKQYKDTRLRAIRNRISKYDNREGVTGTENKPIRELSHSVNI